MIEATLLSVYADVAAFNILRAAWPHLTYHSYLASSTPNNPAFIHTNTTLELGKGYYSSVGYMDPSSGNDQEMRADDQSLESILTGPKVQQDMMRKQEKPQPEQALKCPRCDSTNTKFCYYNNYSLSQPRYFCKSCRRYWTKGGTLRNVPVGGGCRKNKRAPSSSSKRNLIITHQDNHSNTNPLLANLYDSGSSELHLPLAFSQLQKLSNGHFGNYAHDHLPMDHLGFPEAQGLNMQNLNLNMYHGFADGSMGEVNSGVSNHQELMFPCEEVKQEACSGRESESRFLLGNFPWQISNGDGVNNVGDFSSSIRGSWNHGIISSSNWHGLLNSPLM